MADLLPCPFCNSNDLTFPQSRSGFVVHCVDCFASGPDEPTKAEAAAEWNRRASPWRDIGSTPKDVIAEVAAERLRQVTDEGWTPEHDDRHVNGELGKAAACYAWAATIADNVREAFDLPNSLGVRGWSVAVILRRLWPWAPSWWKPKDRRRDLVRAAALLIAEIERLDRAAQPLPAAPTEGDAP